GHNITSKLAEGRYVENRSLFPTEAGTPQGGIISPTLANITLEGMEKLLESTLAMTVSSCRHHWRARCHSLRALDKELRACGSSQLCDKAKRTHRHPRGVSIHIRGVAAAGVVV